MESRSAPGGAALRRVNSRLGVAIDDLQNMKGKTDSNSIDTSPSSIHHRRHLRDINMDSNALYLLSIYKPNRLFLLPKRCTRYLLRVCR